MSIFLKAISLHFFEDFNIPLSSMIFFIQSSKIYCPPELDNQEFWCGLEKTLRPHKLLCGVLRRRGSTIILRPPCWEIMIQNQSTKRKAIAWNPFLTVGEKTKNSFCVYSKRASHHPFLLLNRLEQKTVKTQEKGGKIAQILRQAFTQSFAFSFLYFHSSVHHKLKMPIWLVFETLKLVVKQCYQTGQF